MTSYTETLHRTSGSEQLLKLLLVPEVAFTADGTNYWTFEVLKVGKKPDGVTRQDYGERVGYYSLATRSLTVGSPIVLYDDARGLAMSDGDELRSVVTSVGSPVALTRPSLLRQFQKAVR